MKKFISFFYTLGLMLGALAYNVSEQLSSNIKTFAVTQNPITGRMKGKFSNAVFSTQFGKNTMRSKALEVRNPKTPAQLLQRAKFTLVISYMGAILSIVKIGFQKVANGMSPYNVAVSNFIRFCISGPINALVVDWTLLKISAGTLLGFLNLDATILARAVTILWDDNSGADNAIATDKVYLIALNITQKMSVQDLGTVARVIEIKVINLPTTWLALDVVKIYAFAKSADGQIISDSQFVKSFTLA